MNVKITKSIAIIDTPVSCMACPLCHHSYDYSSESHECPLTGISVIGLDDCVSEQCPLKEVNVEFGI